MSGWGDTERMHRVETADAGGADEAASLREVMAQVGPHDRRRRLRVRRARRGGGVNRRLKVADARKPISSLDVGAHRDTGDEAAQRRVLGDVLTASRCSEVVPAAALENRFARLASL